MHPVQHLFEQHPDRSEFHFTEDGLAHFTENAAQHHVKNLTKKGITKVTRAQMEAEVAKAAFIDARGVMPPAPLNPAHEEAAITTMGQAAVDAIKGHAADATQKAIDAKNLVDDGSDFEHEITEEDLKNNPDLVGKVEVGDVVTMTDNGKAPEPAPKRVKKAAPATKATAPAEPVAKKK